MMKDGIKTRQEGGGKKEKLRKLLFSFLLSFSFFLLFSCVGCAKPEHRDSQFSMGTFVEVVSDDPRASEIVFKEFKRLEAILSLFDETSELSRLNEKGSLVASPDFFDILKKSKAFYAATDGAFDVSIAPVSLIWKKAIRQKTLPDPDALKAVLGLVGLDNLFLDEVTRRVMLLESGMKLDLGGIAKGYAVDLAVARLKEARVSSALINAGGNIYALGNRRGKPWQVGIRDPRRENAVLEKTDLENKGAATSGDYEQFFVFKNKRYSHIINPVTGYPADAGVISATIIAHDATTADALSTTCVLLGPKKCAGFLVSYPGVRARLVDESGKIIVL
jgi:thiamine biosynthesis lipoprotein